MRGVDHQQSGMFSTVRLVFAARLRETYLVLRRAFCLPETAA